MKKISICALVVSLLCLAYALGRLHEQEKSLKDYQAACVLNDVCHYMVDNIGVDAEEIYCDYIDNLECDPAMIVTREDIEAYNWCYNDWRY